MASPTPYKKAAGRYRFCSSSQKAPAMHRHSTPSICRQTALLNKKAGQKAVSAASQSPARRPRFFCPMAYTKAASPSSQRMGTSAMSKAALFWV